MATETKQMDVVKEVPDGWTKTNLGSVVELIGGGTPKTSVMEYWNGDIPWLSVTDFNNSSRWVYTTEKTISELGLENSSTKLLNAGDIIISARGTVGALAQLKVPMTFNQSCYGIREKRNVSIADYIFYLVSYSLKQISRNTHGAVFDTITKDTFDKISVVVPSLLEQKAIADVLSSFDNKIELLREQNETLEKTAQTIFHERFGKYGVDDKLPEGWRVGKMKEMVDLQGGFVHDTKISGPSITKIAKMGVVNGKDWFNRNSVIEYSKPIDSKYKLEEDDLIVCTRDVTQDRVVIGNVALVPSDLAEYGLYAGSNTWIIKTNVNTHFLFFLFRSPVFRQHIIASSKGSTIVMITRDAFLELDTVIPSLTFIDSLLIEIGPYFEKIKNNIQEVQVLIKTRDLLLPKLMTGEIRVS